MQDFRCDCGGWDGEPADVSATTYPRAAKEHKCCECGQVIKPWEIYQLVRGLWEGEWDTFRTCLPCSRIRKDFCRGGFIFGELRQTISECLGFDYVTFPNGEE